MPRLSGAQAMIEMLVQAGIGHLFGNPGTTELPLADALANDSRIKFILGLHEIPVMSAADGFAMASGQVAVVNLHASCGLGNAMGMLYNAHREGTPLVVTAGQADRRLMFEEPILWSDLARVAQPWTKWSAEVSRVEDLPVALRRAMQIALAPPTGPVFLSIPMDVQSEVAELDLAPLAALDTRTRPATEAVARAAQVLAQAKRPGILAGSRLVERHAVSQLVKLAELLGAPVMTESGTSHGRLAFPSDHPLYGQAIPLWSPEVRDRLREFDVLFVAGMDLLRQYVYFEPSRAIPEHVRLVHLDENPWQIGKNYPAEVGLVGDLQAGIAELNAQLATTQTESQRADARRRGGEYAATHRAQREQLETEIAALVIQRPIAPKVLMASLARVLPRNVAVVEEAVTTTNMMFERLGALGLESAYFGHRGWALGWGLGCAIGVQLAWPQRPVLGIIGEGSTMFGVQALWTAARYNVPVTYVVCNNAQYRILKVGSWQMQLPAAAEQRFVGMDLVEPEVDIVAIARAMGVEAERIEHPDQLAARVRESLAAHDRPRLFDVPIDRNTPERMDYGQVS
ncbi:MAG: thiamine pyrophosphate-binding protein [Planctomycetes bacterium]|nr:thiamine pyrophosphate-binding protein [Planctomycetota bacterium]